MREYQVNVEWTNKGVMTVLARSAEEAIKIAQEDTDLPESYDLIEDSVKAVDLDDNVLYFQGDDRYDYGYEEI